MLFGKSTSDQFMLEQEEIRKKIYGVERFAHVLPVKLKSGQWIWREKYYSYYHGGTNEDGTLFLWSSSPDSYTPFCRNYLHRDEAHVSLTHHR